MIVFLDTNVYIGAKYIFDSGRLGSIKNLVATNRVSLLYTSATANEVKQHIEKDIGAAVVQYNRVLRKGMPALNCDAIFGLKSLDEDQAVNSIKSKLDQFYSIDGVEQASLNPLDAEKLMEDYFNQTPPFESKKPTEFKDAIIINAIKQYQLVAQKQICIVSNDTGFRRAFEDDKNFIVFGFLSDFLSHYNKSEAELACISEFLSDKITDGDLDDVIKSYLIALDIDRGYYGEWECEDKEIDSICCELLYIEKADGQYMSNISADIEISIDITYRDEDRSYYDKEDGAYLIEHFVHAIEKHRVSVDIFVACDVEQQGEELVLRNFTIIEDNLHKCIGVDEETLFDSEEIENTLREEPNLEYCSECGALLGRTQDGAYFDYYGNPLCSKCVVSDGEGELCPMCGRKVPRDFMMSGFCKDCESEMD